MAWETMGFVTTENRKKVLTMTEYIKNPLSGKLRGVTYEDGKIIDVHIRDTDDVVKVFVPVRNGRWVTHSDRPDSLICSVCNCGFDMWKHDPHNYCPSCGAVMEAPNA